MFKKNRIGTFTVTTDFLMDASDDVRRGVFGDVIIVRAEHTFHSRHIEYRAYSKHFDPCPQYEMPPEYRPVVHTKDGTFDRVEWKRLR